MQLSFFTLPPGAQELAAVQATVIQYTIFAIDQSFAIDHL